jgi:hypothetical protein
MTRRTSGSRPVPQPDRRTATDIAVRLAAYNANFVEGEPLTGANTPRQGAILPRLAAIPYWTDIRSPAKVVAAAVRLA